MATSSSIFAIVVVRRPLVVASGVGGLRPPKIEARVWLHHKRLFVRGNMLGIWC